MEMRREEVEMGASVFVKIFPYLDFNKIYYWVKLVLYFKVPQYRWDI